MPRPVAVRALPGFKLWLRYSDGVEGEVDLSYLAGRGVFSAWNDRGFFESVFIDQSGGIAWHGNLDICPDALYMKITGKTPEEMFSRQRPAIANA